MFLKFAKAVYVILIFYIFWYQEVFFEIENILLFLGIGMISFWLLHKVTSKKDRIYLTKPIIIWFVFFIYIFSTGFIVASDKMLLISSVMFYGQILIVMFFIIDVSITEKSNNFFVYSFIVLGLISAITIVFFGYESSRGQLHLSENSNPNNDGRVLVFGIFSMILLLINVRKKLIVITLLCAILFTFYAIILTGSRQVFLSGSILLVISLSIITIKKWKRMKNENRLLLSALAIMILFFIVIKYESIFIGSTLQHRLTEDQGADLLRIDMLKTSLDYFKENPFIGIGFDQFRVHYGGYSHSTYTEIISTTGMIGSILYFAPYLIIIYNLIKVDKTTKNIKISIQAKIYLVLMLTLLSSGTASIHFYRIPENIMLSLMISFYYIQIINDNAKKTRNSESGKKI